jgi:pyruvate/2-oxoglutarate dehydrogenase complex dihydrolipoamide dehydrogenase (E3) component
MLPSMSEYDFAVVGGGSAGYGAAATAARLGLRTVVIEGGKELGGLCILRGCMPSKTLLESANRFRTLRRAAEFGLSAGHLAYDATQIVARKRRLIGDFAGYRAEQLEAGTFDLIRGAASFIDPHRIRVVKEEAEEEVQARTILVATGSVLNVVDIPGLAEVGYLHSDLALDSERIPKSVVILGGGAIALEFAHFYEALGSKVTVIQRSPQVLKEQDSDVAEALTDAYRHRGINLVCDTRLLRFERNENGKTVIFEHGGEKHAVEAEEIFYALGRRPAVDGLNLEATGVRIGQDGAIEVSETMQTTQPHIFAAGDVTGLFEVVHIAIEQGTLAARNARRLVQGLAPEPMDYRLKLFGVFSDPQVAVVGLSEREAQERGESVRVAKYPFNDHGKSLIHGEPEGFVKLICAAESGEILGAAVVGPEGTELIHEIVVAMRFRATAADLASTPHYHPTLSEIWTYPAEELGGV